MSKTIRIRLFSFLLIASLLLSIMLTSLHTRPARAQSSSQLLNYLYSISGNHTLAGQQGSGYMAGVRNASGRDAALWGEDFSFVIDGHFGGSSMYEFRSRMTAEAKQRWASGQVVALMWHACPPTLPEPCAWDGGVVSHLSDAQWTQLITPGTSLSNAWVVRMDAIVPFLQDLEDSGVEVLWRPFHEMNQGVFWWGGRTGANGTRRLYQQMYDYFVNVKGLSNLVWVWSVQDLSTNFNDYNPGSSYYDVFSLDIYDASGYTTAKYNQMLSIAGNKPIAIGECQTLPSASLLASQPRWTFFMGWRELTLQHNSASTVSSIYNASNVTTLNEMPGWTSTSGTNLARNRPVTVSSAEGTNVAANAVDTNSGTRWSSAFSNPQWIQVDLGATYSINRVILNWEAAYGTAYQIQVSNNASTWTTIYSTTSGNGSTDDLTGLSGSGRYIRMYGTARATAYGFSLWEFRVYGSTATPPPTTPPPTTPPPTTPAPGNLALNKPVLVSSTEAGTNVAANAVDGSASTRWSSLFSDPQWIRVDLGATYNISRVYLSWEAAYGSAYQIQVSNDGNTWTTIYSTTTGNGGIDDLTGLSGSGRYVRMHGTTRATQYGYSLWEMQVFGTGGTPTPTTPAPSGINTSAWYSLRARHSSKCVDARASGTANGTAIQQYTCNNGYAQQFQFQLVSGNTYRIVNRNNASAMIDVAGQSTADGGLIQLWAGNGQTNQQWQAVSESGGYYHFVSVGSGKCLDVPASSTADSIQLQQWACNGNFQQSFSLVQQP